MPPRAVRLPAGNGNNGDRWVDVTADEMIVYSRSGWLSPGVYS